MTSTPEDIIRDALRREGSSDPLAALGALVGERNALVEELRDADAENARLRRIEEAASRVLSEMGGRRSATPMLSAIAELRAALREHGAKER